MNQKAKRRHQLGQFGPGWDEPEPVKAEIAKPSVEPVGEGQHSFGVSEDQAGWRLDKFLAHAAGLSRSRIKALIESAQVSIDQAPAPDSNQKLRLGQMVEIHVPAAAPAQPKGEAMSLTIIFEDEHLIIVDKPVGLVVHPSNGHETGTLVNGLIAHCGASLSGIGGVMRPGIVHRIDKDTSGLLVVAKTDAAHQGLSALFADHGRTLSLTREYLAFVWGVPERNHGTIETYIGRHPYQREKQAIVANESRGRLAITHYEQETIYPHAAGAKSVISLVRCHLETGRTHQIRVHMTHIGHPLVGDATYGAGFKTKVAHLPPKIAALVDGLHRQALHAAVLGFEHPITGEELMFESALPADLQQLADALADQV